MICWICKKDFPTLTKDHFIPRSFGGRDGGKNIRRACQQCNANRKHRMTLAELLEVNTMDPFEVYNVPPTIPLSSFKKMLKHIASSDWGYHPLFEAKKDRRSYKSIITGLGYYPKLRKVRFTFE